MSKARTVIELTGVDVRYRKSLAVARADYADVLKDINFAVHAGETLGVVGRNGAGKSTLLRVLADIIKPDRGTVWRSSRRVAMLTLQVSLLPHLSGRENAIISGIMMGMHRRDIEHSMAEIIEFSELADYIDDAVRTYSSGMKARLGFAVAKQADPDVLLIDEVLAVGDAAFREKSRQAIISRIRSDRTVVLVSHSDTTIREYCDRAVWIDDGRVRGLGSSATIVDDYLAHSPAPQKAN